MRNKIITGDALEMLRTMPDEYIQCIVTSPPYYSLRDYGMPGQIGLEDTPEQYIEKLVAIFREAKRVLRHDGTLWCNIGDSYAAGGGADYQRLDELGERMGTGGGKKHSSRKSGRAPIPAGLKPKDLIGIPWMLAFALRADGWYLRSDVIWHKPNCMPESVEDRPTKSHEYLFLLSKSERYYYDHMAILEPFSENVSHVVPINHKGGAKYVPMGGTHGGPTSTLGPEGGLTDRAGRNKRSVWTIPTSPYSEAHFAVFPAKLIEPAILAGTSSRACEVCGAPWERVTERDKPLYSPPSEIDRYGTGEHGVHRKLGSAYTKLMNEHPKVLIGWQPTCSCANNTGSGKCIVLDPFMGAGTVALVAIQHGRDYLGIELNPEYVKLIEKRIAYVQQNLWSRESEWAV